VVGNGLAAQADDARRRYWTRHSTTATPLGERKCRGRASRSASRPSFQIARHIGAKILPRSISFLSFFLSLSLLLYFLSSSAPLSSCSTPP
jgi:hypothetical protein